MLRPLLALALLGVGASRPSAPPQYWPVQRYVEWQPEWKSRIINAAGLTARIEVERCGKDRPASEECFEGGRYLVATVRAPGMKPVTMRGEPGVTAFVGIGKLTPDATQPSLILISENGGSAGCVEIDLAVPQMTGYERVRLSAGEDDDGTQCRVDPSRLAWPRDMTGHGRPEFQLLDTRFQCRLTSCAGSWYPPRIVALDGRKGVDVSSDPALTPLYLIDMVKARHACENAKEEAQGACAGYAADAARVGQLPQAWRVIHAQVQRGCRVPFSDVCLDTNRIPTNFPAELAPLLPAAG